MGNKFVVKVWEQYENDYRWCEVYRGEDMAEALATFFREKAAGSGCVVLEWR
jgi:hypothetical protein